MRRAGWLALAVALPRLLVLFFNENLGGDAIARTWLAHRWLEAPHLITSFDGGGKQFGPLHLYLLAFGEWLWPSLLHAGRVSSLVVGVATAWPLFVFTRRRFGDRAATLAVLGFAAWGLHVQCSTTSASEALNLLCVMSAVAWFDAADTKRGAWWGAALALNLACATRYDSWLLVPLLAVVEWWRTRRLLRGAAFGAVSVAFAGLWLGGNFLALGDALFPIRFIDTFHREWWPAEAALWGEGPYRVMCLLFWPGAALLTLTPALAIPAGLALRRLWVERVELRWVVVLIVLPSVGYGVRGAVFSTFAPLARFTMKELLFLLPLAGWWLSARSARVQAAALVVAATWCVALGAFTFRPDSRWSFSLRSISATSRMEIALREPADWLRANAAPRGLLMVDEDPRGFDDLPLSYYSGFPFDQQLRRRYEHFEVALVGRSPEWLVVFDGGRLEREGALSGESVFRGRSYVLRATFGSRRIFQAVP